MMRKAKETGNAEFFWEAHLVGKNKEYCHMEQLVNLDALPYSGFKVAVFPPKLLELQLRQQGWWLLFD